MADSKTVLSFIQAFFQDYLAGQRGLSPNTTLAYRDALKLSLSFLALRGRKEAARLQLDDLRAEQVLAFLDDVEQNRHNCSATRNLRLAAIRTFFRFMISEDTIRSGQYQQIVAICVWQANLTHHYIPALAAGPAIGEIADVEEQDFNDRFVMRKHFAAGNVLTHLRMQTLNRIGGVDNTAQFHRVLEKGGQKGQ